MGVAYDIAARLNAHIDERMSEHHIAYAYQEKGTKSSKFRWYVCKCNLKQHFSRTEFNRHQREALHTIVMEPIG
jgi:hypothetical protein